MGSNAGVVFGSPHWSRFLFYAGPAGNGIILIDAAIKGEEGYLMPGGTE